MGQVVWARWTTTGAIAQGRGWDGGDGEAGETEESGL